jgi:hypothetical protein
MRESGAAAHRTDRIGGEQRRHAGGPGAVEASVALYGLGRLGRLGDDRARAARRRGRRGGQHRDRRPEAADLAHFVAERLVDGRGELERVRQEVRVDVVLGRL